MPPDAVGHRRARRCNENGTPGARGRARTAALVRHHARLAVDGPVHETWKLGYLIDTIYLLRWHAHHHRPVLSSSHNLCHRRRAHALRGQRKRSRHTSATTPPQAESKARRLPSPGSRRAHAVKIPRVVRSRCGPAMVTPGRLSARWRPAGRHRASEQVSEFAFSLVSVMLVSLDGGEHSASPRLVIARMPTWSKVLARPPSRHCRHAGIEGA
jgi:hypothetical protein